MYHILTQRALWASYLPLRTPLLVKLADPDRAWSRLLHGPLRSIEKTSLVTALYGRLRRSPAGSRSAHPGCKNRPHSLCVVLPPLSTLSPPRPTHTSLRSQSSPNTCDDESGALSAPTRSYLGSRSRPDLGSEGAIRPSSCPPTSHAPTTSARPAHHTCIMCASCMHHMRSPRHGHPV